MAVEKASGRSVLGLEENVSTCKKKAALTDLFPMTIPLGHFKISLYITHKPITKRGS